MKKYILALFLATAIISLTGCPNSETQDDPYKEKYVNTTDEDLNIECAGDEKTESVDPTVPTEPDEYADDNNFEEDHTDSPEDTNDETVDIITPEDVPYEWEEAVPNDDYVCEAPDPSTYDAKPVIYLYPEETTEISVKLDYNGTFTTTYPAYNDGWKVIAEPDGTITYNDREYYCLFWEGISNVSYAFNEGFCVKGEDTEKFLEESLKKLGLTDKEANEFIIYWLPKMENNTYNLISFQEELYTDNAKLTVSPAPDTVIRVFMAWKNVDEFIEIEPQTLTAPERIGFTVIEWGGAKLK